MSESAEDIKKGDSSNENICRDYIRGMCDRRFCRFKHENDGRSLSFCHDFQNTGCPRPTCKFIHCSAEEVEEYKRIGEMSNQILIEASRKNQLPGIQPICNLFKKGVCRRQHCKFRHVTKQEEDAEILELMKSNANKKRPHSEPPILSESHLSFAVEPINFVESVARYVVDDDGFLPHKRRFITSNGIDFNAEPLQTRNTFAGYCVGNPPTMIRLDARTIMLEEENSMLQKEIAQLQKQVSDLTATNEFLLDQNATLRVSSKRTLAVTLPTATITNTMTHNTSPQQVLRTVASVSAVPVSLATVTTCNPVSVSPVSITGCPSVSITPTTQILAPSQQILVTTNQPAQLALATNSSQAQLAIAQQNLANNLAVAAQQAVAHQAAVVSAATARQPPQPSGPQATGPQTQQQEQGPPTAQLTLTLPTTAGSAIQQAAVVVGTQGVQLAAAQSHLTSQAQQLGQQLTTQAQQLGQQLTTQAQQLALANSSQAQQQLALANTIAANAAAAATNTQLTSQALVNTPSTQQQLTVASMNQQLALATSNCGQLLAAAAAVANTSGPALDLHHHHHHHRAAQVNINTSQTIAMSQAGPQPLVSYPLMTQTMTHPMSH